MLAVVCIIWVNNFFFEKQQHIHFFCFVAYAETMNNRRPALGEYIDEKLTEQQIVSYANDTQLHYRYEGEGSIASDLSSLESTQYQEEHDFRFLYSWGPKFSRLADLYAGGLEDDINNLDNA